MSPMTMPKPSEQAKAAFHKLVPPDPAVTTRPMFGNLSAFVNGNMFCGLFGEDLFVRVSEGEQAKIRKQGGKAFEPMPGRAMTGYVVVPGGLVLAIGGIALAGGRVTAALFVGAVAVAVLSGAVLGREIFALLGWDRLMRVAQPLHARVPLERASGLLRRGGWRAVFTAR